MRGVFRQPENSFDSYQEISCRPGRALKPSLPGFIYSFSKRVSCTRRYSRSWMFSSACLNQFPPWVVGSSPFFYSGGDGGSWGAGQTACPRCPCLWVQPLEVAGGRLGDFPLPLSPEF